MNVTQLVSELDSAVDALNHVGMFSSKQEALDELNAKVTTAFASLNGAFKEESAATLKPLLAVLAKAEDATDRSLSSITARIFPKQHAARIEILSKISEYEKSHAELTIEKLDVAVQHLEKTPVWHVFERVRDIQHVESDIGKLQGAKEEDYIGLASRAENALPAQGLGGKIHEMVFGGGAIRGFIAKLDGDTYKSSEDPKVLLAKLYVNIENVKSGEVDEGIQGKIKNALEKLWPKLSYQEKEDLRPKINELKNTARKLGLRDFAVDIGLIEERFATKI